MIIYRHHVNWSTYNKKKKRKKRERERKEKKRKKERKKKKKASPPANHPQHFATTVASEGEF